MRTLAHNAAGQVGAYRDNGYRRRCLDAEQRMFFGLVRRGGSHITASFAANRRATRWRTAMLGSVRSTVCRRRCARRSEWLAAN